MRIAADRFAGPLPSGHGGWARLRFGDRAWVVSLLLGLLAAAWAAIVVAQHFLGRSLPLPGSALKLAPYSMPALVLAIALFSRRSHTKVDRSLMIAVLVLGTAVIAMPRMLGSYLNLAIIPALVAATWLGGRRPALALTIVLALSGTFGSLIAFWHFPVTKFIEVLLVGLWLSVLLRPGRRVEGTRFVLGAAVIAGFLAFTLVQVGLSDTSSVAFKAFTASAWYMGVALLVGFAGWSHETRARIARAFLVIAMLVGAYAVLRLITGPAQAEFNQLSGTPYNYVNGKLKPAGSFPTAQDMGTWMAVVIPFCLAAILTWTGRWRVVALTAFGLCTVALIASRLRIALFADVAGLIVVLFLYQFTRGFPGLRLGVTATALAIGCAMVVLSFAVTGANSTSHSYNALLHPNSDQSYIERRDKWQQAFRDLRGHPFGYGVGTSQSPGQFYLNIGASNIDNGYLKVALEQGVWVMGLLVAGLVLISLSLAATAVRAPGRFSGGMAIGAAGTLVSFAVVMLAVTATDGPRALPAWIIVGLGLAEAAAYRSNVLLPRTQPGRNRPLDYGASAA
jgi:hypothetical protein